MKKLIFTFFAALLTSFMVKSQPQADLTIYKGTDIAEINGYEDDEVWSKVTPIMITNKFDNEEPTVDGSYFKMFYTDEYIYVLVDVTDDVHYPVWVAEDLKQEYLYDKVEVYFDVNDVLKDGKGPAYINGHMDAGHYQMAPYLNEDYYEVPYEPVNVVFGSLSGKATICYSLKMDYSGYTMEYRFPMSAFVNDTGSELNLQAFKTLPQGLGFDVMIVDNDNDGKSRKRAVWKNVGPVEPYSIMDNCGVVVFSDLEVGTGIENIGIEDNQLNTYPNPVKDILYVNGNVDKIELFNIFGQLIKTSTDENYLNMTDVIDGLYFVKAYENGIYKGISKVTKK